MISMRTLIFAIPGTIIGFFVMTLLLDAMKLIVYAYVEFKIYTEIDNFTIFMVRT